MEKSKEEKIASLKEAGIKIRANASDETVEEEWQKLNQAPADSDSEQESDGDETVEEGLPVSYIGVKLVSAEPMTASEAEDIGYRTESEESDGYQVTYQGGYQSWSPKSVFEDAYFRVDENEADVILNRFVEILQEAQEAVEPSEPDEFELAYQAALSRAESGAGDKDPDVVQWCRENMTPEQFAEKYHHRGIK